MKKTKALLDFIVLPVNDKLEFYKYIANQLANATLFPSPDITIAMIKTVIDNFETAILAAKDGSHSALAVRNDKEKLADDVFRILVNYVNRIADGDETIIIKSGFNASKQPIPFQKAELSVIYGEHSGSVMVIIKAILNAVAYKIQYRKTSVSGLLEEWLEAEISTSASCLIANLIPGTKYDFRFASISSAGTSDFSNPISIIVI